MDVNRTQEVDLEEEIKGRRLRTVTETQTSIEVTNIKIVLRALVVLQWIYSCNIWDITGFSTIYIYATM